jgi:hypothetical protein
MPAEPRVARKARDLDLPWPDPRSSYLRACYLRTILLLPATPILDHESLFSEARQHPV